jgi:hypothetical protein
MNRRRMIQCLAALPFVGPLMGKSHAVQTRDRKALLIKAYDSERGAALILPLKGEGKIDIRHVESLMDLRKTGPRILCVQDCHGKWVVVAGEVLNT